jgi:hypothetical protein
MQAKPAMKYKKASKIDTLLALATFLALLAILPE